MAVLSTGALCRILARGCWPAILACLFLVGPNLPAQTPVSREYQVKAVFLFNFTQFVEWPPGAFPDSQAPFIIGIMGEDPFGSILDDTVRGEKSGAHPLLVRRVRPGDDVGDCQILFIGSAESNRLDSILTGLKGRSILTVGDADSFARRGGMIGFVTLNNKIRLRINLAAARLAGLTISSKLLRPSEIVSDAPN